MALENGRGKENEPEVDRADQRTLKKRAAAETSRSEKRERMGEEAYLKEKADAERERKRKLKLQRAAAAAAPAMPARASRTFRVHAARFPVRTCGRARWRAARVSSPGEASVAGLQWKA